MYCFVCGWFGWLLWFVALCFVGVVCSVVCWHWFVCYLACGLVAMLVTLMLSFTMYNICLLFDRMWLCSYCFMCYLFVDVLL